MSLHVQRTANRFKDSDFQVVSKGEAGEGKPKARKICKYMNRK